MRLVQHFVKLMNSLNVHRFKLPVIILIIVKHVCKEKISRVLLYVDK